MGAHIQVHKVLIHNIRLSLTYHIGVMSLPEPDSKMVCKYRVNHDVSHFYHKLTSYSSAYMCLAGKFSLDSYCHCYHLCFFYTF